MSGFCLGVAFSVIEAMIPADALTLAWTHSVEKTRWEEDYRLVRGGMTLTEARIQGSGAGMETPDDARQRDGYWHYRPRLGVLPKLTLARSGQAGDYELCWNGRCNALDNILPPLPNHPVIELFPCLSAQPSPQPGTRDNGGAP